jgi:hypothetical protein
MMTNEQLEGLERREQAATPGPWEASVDYIETANETYGTPALCGPNDSLLDADDDYSFAAVARNALPELIKDLREARAEVARLRSLQTTDGEGERVSSDAALENLVAFASELRARVEGLKPDRWSQHFDALTPAPALAPDAQPDDAVLP